MAKLRNWNEMFENDHPDVTDTLSEAKQHGKKFYRHACKIHGPTVYATLDNSCPHCVRELANQRRKANVEFNRPRELVNGRQRRARERNISFSITVDDVRGHIPDRCPTLDIPLQFNGGDKSPSIDRLNNNEGYTKENTRIISTRANRIKSDGTAEEHLRIAFWQLRESGADTQKILTIIRKLLGDN